MSLRFLYPDVIHLDDCLHLKSLEKYKETCKFINKNYVPIKNNYKPHGLRINLY